MVSTARRVGVALAALTLTSALSACDIGSGGSQLRFMVPNAPGSGWDLTARTAAQALDDSDISGRVNVFNVDGANGVVGLARLLGESGNPRVFMQMGLGLIAATVTQDSELSLQDTTPIAKLIDDYEVVVVRADSPYQTLEELVAAWQEDEHLKIGGGSAFGGADHITPLLIADANGIDTREVNYVSFGGGAVLPAILGGQVDFGVTGIGDSVAQIQAGELRALGVSGSERYFDLPDVPTLTEAGTDVVFANWRGVVAPPDLTDEEAEELVDLFRDLHDSEEWQDAVTRNGWADDFVSGDEFGEYIVEQTDQVETALEGVNL